MESTFKNFGEFAKEMRLKMGFTLRKFCLEFGYDPGNHSKIERGLSGPPSSEEKQVKLAGDLGIPKGSSDWNEFFDLAALCKGKLPPSILSDEELVMKLPFVFRTLRGDKMDDDKLMDFVKQLREL